MTLVNWQTWDLNPSHLTPEHLFIMTLKCYQTQQNIVSNDVPLLEKISMSLNIYKWLFKDLIKMYTYYRSSLKALVEDK